MATRRRKQEKMVKAGSGPTSDLRRNALKRTGTIADFFGCLAGKTTKVATLEEIQRATEDGWAGLVYIGDERDSGSHMKVARLLWSHGVS